MALFQKLGEGNNVNKSSQFVLPMQDKHGHLYKDMESGSNDSIDLERLMKSFQARLDSMGGGGVGASGEINVSLISLANVILLHFLARSERAKYRSLCGGGPGGRGLRGHAGRSKSVRTLISFLNV